MSSIVHRCNPFITANRALLDLFQKKPLKHVVLQKGEVLYPDNNQSLIGYVVEGILKIVVLDEEGDEKVLWFLGEGSLIVCFPQNTVYREAVAAKTTKIIMMDKDDFLDAMLADRMYFDFFLEQNYIKMQYFTDSFLSYEKNTSKIKIYTLLQQLGKSYGSMQLDGSVYIRNFLSRSDMASITGIHRSNIIRYIGELEKMNIIRKEKKDIIILQPQRLEQLIHKSEDNLELGNR